MASLATPRVLPEHLHHFAPSSGSSTSMVRMLGTITSIAGDQATLQSGSGSVTLILNRDSHLAIQSTQEIIGKVINLEGGQGLGIRVLSYTEWPKREDGKGVDMKAFEAVVDATHRYKEIFYGDSAGAGQSESGY